MQQTLQALNELEHDGFIQRYALGGAVAALFYMDPFETEDLDVFVLLAPTANPLMPLAPLYEELRNRNYQEDGPYVLMHGVPVQFLPAYNALIEEAVASAKEIPYESTTTRIPPAEYLAAIMVQTGRRKDRVRLETLREQVSLDSVLLDDILTRHHLSEQYATWIS